MNFRIGAEQAVWRLLLILAGGLVAMVAHQTTLGSAPRLSHKNFTCLSNASNLLGQSAKSSSAS